MSEHKATSVKKRNKLYNSVRKYGWDSFICEVIYQSYDGKHCINIMEPHFIKEFDTFKNGYNSTNGGEGGSYERESKTKKKMSLARKKRFNAKDKDGNIFVITNDDPRFISGELVGIKKGTKTSKETSKKLSISRIGNKNRLGVSHTDQTKKIISERTSAALKGVAKKVITCPHCNKSGGSSNMKRYHYNNCKSLR